MDRREDWTEPMISPAADATARAVLDGLTPEVQAAVVRRAMLAGPSLDTSPPVFQNFPFAASPQHGHRASISTVATSRTGFSAFTELTDLTDLSGATPSSSSASISTRASKRARFWCTSCESAFVNKSDWQLHEEKYHEPWRIYPCPHCNVISRHPNEFNKHHKHSHARCDTCPDPREAPYEAERILKRRTGWACGFCAQFHSDMKSHYRHVGNEYEKGKAKGHWDHSKVIYGLLRGREDLHREWLSIVEGEVTQGRLPGNRKVNFSWVELATSRVTGFAEGHASGHLQDRLEFYDPSRHRARDLAAWAYRLVDKLHMPRKYVSGNIGDANASIRPLPALPGAPAQDTTRQLISSHEEPASQQSELMDERLFAPPQRVTSLMAVEGFRFPTPPPTYTSDYGQDDVASLQALMESVEEHAMADGFVDPRGWG